MLVTNVERGIVRRLQSWRLGVVHVPTKVPSQVSQVATDVCWPVFGHSVHWTRPPGISVLKVKNSSRSAKNSRKFPLS